MTKYNLIGGAFDFDETLVESIKAITTLVNKEFGFNVSWDSVHRYNFEDAYPSIPKNEILKYFETDEFFNILTIKPNTIETLYTLNSLGYFLKIVTIGTAKNLAKKKEWINQNILPFVPIQTIGIERESSEMGKGCVDLKGYLLLDDHQTNLMTSNATVKVLYRNIENASWNNLWVGRFVTDIIECIKYFER